MSARRSALLFCCCWGWAKSARLYRVGVSNAHTQAGTHAPHLWIWSTAATLWTPAVTLDTSWSLQLWAQYFIFFIFIFVTPRALRSYTFLFHKFPTVPWQNKLTRFSRVGLFHTLRLDDTSDIQKPVVLLASWSISSQSGGVYLGECINGPTNQRQGYEADWINTVEVPVHYAPVCLPR